MPLTSDQAKALAADVIASQRGTVIDTAAEGFDVFAGLLHALDFVLPGAGDTAAKIIEAITAHSLTVPGPTGPLVVLARNDTFDAVHLVMAAAGQAVHAAYMSRAGAVQSATDYLNGELRARIAANVAVAQLFARYLLAGGIPTVDELVEAAHAAVAPLPLADVDIAMVRGIVGSHVDGFRDGERPNIGACGAVLRWLRDNAPEAIVAPDFMAGRS